MKIEWSKIFPKVTGWYWVKYQYKNFEVEGIIKDCHPCEVVFYMNVPYLRLEGFTITEENMSRFGFVDVQFGPKIEEPNEVVYTPIEEYELNEFETFDEFEDNDEFEEIPDWSPLKMG